METNRLHQFKILVETGNLRRAADLMGISHSGLSKSMHTLESELGIKLFEQRGRTLEITTEGRFLYQQAQPILLAIDALNSVGKKQNAASKPLLRIGTFEVFSTYLATQLAEATIESEISFQELTPGNLENALIDYHVDVGITYNPIPKPELEFVKITEISMTLCCAENSAFDKLPFPSIPFAIPLTSIHGSPTKVKGLDGWPDDRLPRSVKFRVTLMETAIELLRSGLAVAYLPEFIVRLHNQRVNSKFRLKQLPLPSKINTTQTVYLVKRKNNPETKAYRQIAKVLRSLK